MREMLALLCGRVFAPFLIVLTLVIPQVSIGQPGQDWRSLSEALNQAMAAGNLELAEQLARQRVKLAAKGPESWAGNANRSLGQVLFLRGRFAEAEALLRFSLPLLERANGRLSFQAIHSQIDLTRLLMSQSRIAEADVVAKDVLERQLAFAPHSPDMIVAYHLQAEIQRLLGKYAEAASSLGNAESVEVSADPTKPNDGKIDPVWLAKTRTQTNYLRAQLELQRGHLTEAEKYARLALNHFRELNGEKHPDVARSLSLLGTILLRQGNDREAETLLHQAVSISTQTPGQNNGNNTQAQLGLAALLAKAGKPEEAEGYFKNAVDRARQSGNLNWFAHLGQGYVRFLVNQRRPAEALLVEREVLDAIDRLFAQTRGLDESSRQNFIAQFGPNYIGALRLLLRLHQAQHNAGYDREALSVVSRTQSRIFTEMMRQADVGKFSGDAAFLALRDKQRELTKQLADLRRASAWWIRSDNEHGIAALETGEPNDSSHTKPVDSAAKVVNPLAQARLEAHRRRLENETTKTSQSLAQVEQELWAKYPRYMELTQPKPVTADALQQLLKPGETLVTYFILPQSTLVFVMDRERFRQFQLPVGRSAISELVAAIRQPEEAAADGLANLAQLNPAQLNRLYTQLFQPIEWMLKPGQQLLVVGDGPLFTLPLEMLVTSYGDAERQAFGAARAAHQAELAEYGTLPYLGQRYRFAYLPSLSALVSLRRYPKPAVSYDRELVSFADPVFAQDGSGTQRGIKTRAFIQGRSLLLPNLPETADEAKAIAAITGTHSKLYLQDKAQEYTAKTSDLRNTRYLHFATHGLLGGEFVELHNMLDESLQNPAGNDNFGMEKLQSDTGLEPAPQAATTSSTKLRQAEPALVLSLHGDLHGEDGLLTMSEIAQNLNLNAQLVVLSACNTAGERAEANNGEGFAGLTRAFMYAGAHSLLVSHWSVESQATKDLIVEVFRRMHSGQNSSAAIEGARMSIRTQVVKGPGGNISRAHPYFWAPFVYVGD